MKILGIIPARGGSKRAPGKNIRVLGGKPLICWTIDAVKKVGDLCEVIVSTDSQEIADLSNRCGIFVPKLRPKELASDHATTVDVLRYEVERYESISGKVDSILVLQPTSPFRSVATIESAIKLHKTSGHKNIVSVSPSRVSPGWMISVTVGGYIKPYFGKGALGLRSQDSPISFVPNGCIYLLSRKNLFRQMSLYNKKTLPLLMESNFEAIDIDEEIDFKLAELLIENGKLLCSNF